MKPLSKQWLIPSLISGIILAIAAWGETGMKELKYIGPFEAEQYAVSYRWLTGHFTHLGWRHSWLNLAGFALIWLVYGRLLSNALWLSFVVICALGISCGLYVLAPDVGYYVGMSGVLHGMLALTVCFALLQPFLQGQDSMKSIRWEDVFLFVGLWGKIAYEQIAGSLPMTTALAGDTVIVDAHFYGACLGTVYALIIFAHQYYKPKFT